MRKKNAKIRIIKEFNKTFLSYLLILLTVLLNYKRELQRFFAHNLRERERERKEVCLFFFNKLFKFFFCYLFFERSKIYSCVSNCRWRKKVVIINFKPIKKLLYAGIN